VRLFKIKMLDEALGRCLYEQRR